MKKNTKKKPPPNYRKVYTTYRPPPGFKIFDNERHYRMHYGNGIMEEEVENARMRMRAAQRASAQYSSPLGGGASYAYSSYRTNVKYGRDKDHASGLEYDYAVISSADQIRSKANYELRGRKAVIDRMNERRRARKESEKQNIENDAKGCYHDFANPNNNIKEESSCSIM